MYCKTVFCRRQPVIQCGRSVQFLRPGGQQLVLLEGRTYKTNFFHALQHVCSACGNPGWARHMPLFPSNRLLGTKRTAAYIPRGLRSTDNHFNSHSQKSGRVLVIPGRIYVYISIYIYIYIIYIYIYMGVSISFLCPDRTPSVSPYGAPPSLWSSIWSSIWSSMWRPIWSSI